jgi:hypothetical protein
MYDDSLFYCMYDTPIQGGRLDKMVKVNDFAITGGGFDMPKLVQHKKISATNTHCISKIVGQGLTHAPDLGLHDDFRNLNFISRATSKGKKKQPEKARLII